MKHRIPSDSVVILRQNYQVTSLIRKGIEGNAALKSIVCTTGLVSLEYLLKMSRLMNSHNGNLSVAWLVLVSFLAAVAHLGSTS